jgi:bacterioferritin-associated ferredoxin
MQSSISGIFIVGDGAGIGGAENAEIEGQIAGNEIALLTGHINLKTGLERFQELQPRLRNQKRFGKLYGDLFTPKPGLISLANDDTILCRCEEVTLGEVKKAVAMGAKTIGEVKMITRSGMGNCQGRMCEHSITGAIVKALSAELATFKTVGFNSIRPPLHPLPVNFLAEVQKELDVTE